MRPMVRNARGARTPTLR